MPPSDAEVDRRRGVRRVISALRHKVWTVRGWVRSSNRSNTDDEQIYWHFTNMRAMPAIMADRVLKPSMTGIQPGERPAVWFTSRRSFAPTAHLGIMTPNGDRRTLTLIEMMEIAGPLIRIGVRRAAVPHDWNGFRREGNVSAEWVSALEIVALDAGDDPREWRLNFEPVPADQWVVVEFWVNNAWFNPSTSDHDIIEETARVHPKRGSE